MTTNLTTLLTMFLKNAISSLENILKRYLHMMLFLLFGAALAYEGESMLIADL